MINEVCAHNSTILVQNDCGSSDYIEVYNRSGESINLKGYGLSDHRGGTPNFVFDDYELPPYSYAIVFAAGWVPDREERIFADFKISDEDTIYLTNPRGKIIDCVAMVHTEANIVYARERDGADNWTTMMGSPWGSNEKSRHILVPNGWKEPEFSVQSGIYENAFELELIGEGNIYYTMDGSTPTLESQQYLGPIWIEDASSQENKYCNRTDFATEPYELPTETVDKAVIVRAIAVSEAGNISDISTATYFVGKQFVEKYQGYDLVSLVADPDDLFGERGIYVLGEINKDYWEGVREGEEEKELEPANYLQHGKSTERKAVIEIFDEKREKVLSQNVGVRLNGNASRMEPLKSFRIFGRNVYSKNDEILYNGFYKQCYPKTLILRKGFGKNQWIPQLVNNRAVAIQNFRPCILFLDGEYWGEYSIQEGCSANFLENYYGVPADQILLVKEGGISVNKWDEKYDLYNQEWQEFEQNIQMWYESGVDQYAVIEQEIDIQSYIDFWCTQIYINNSDLSFDHNVAMWKSQEMTDTSHMDGKWRWILYDLDCTLGEAAKNTFEEPINLNGYQVCSDPLFMTLMRSRIFRERFVTSFIEIAYENFDIKHVEQYFNYLDKSYGTGWIPQDKVFFEKRQEYIWDYLRKQFPEEIKLIDYQIEQKEGREYQDARSSGTAYEGLDSTGRDITLPKGS